jgi:hypothetical protein
MGNQILEHLVFVGKLEIHVVLVPVCGGVRRP